MARYRITSNGDEYRVQKKIFWWWFDECREWNDIMLPLQFPSEQKAKEYIEREKRTWARFVPLYEYE